MEGLSESTAAAPHRVAGVIGAIVLALAAGYASAFARISLPPLVAFVPVVGALSAAAAVVTALLLVTQARATHSLALALLAFAYGFAAISTVPYVFVVSSASRGGGTPSAAWFWVLGHVGFSAVVLASTFVAVRSAERPFLVASWHVGGGLAVALAVVAGFGWFATARAGALPALVATGRYAPLVVSGIGPAVLVLTGVALVSLILGTRLRTVTQLWLAVAMWASFLGVALVLEAGAPYTLGWYVAGLESLAASTILLGSLLATYAALFEESIRRARIDVLTGLPNRRSFEETLEIAIGLASRTDRPTSLLVIDLDHFKPYNDRYGHAVGDAALRSIAAATRATLKRRSDVLARFGGDAFAAILPATSAADAHRLAEEIRTAVERLTIPHAGLTGGLLTVSIGVGTLGVARSRRGVSGHDFVSGVDRALSEAKERGRNAIANVSFMPEVAA